jgi:addiction module RelE/StbE family toxin
MNLVWRARALADLKSIVEYIAGRNSSAALRLHSAIETCARRLRERPYLYRPGRVEGTREAIVHQNYILIYRVGAETVEVVRLVHSRQQYP